MSQVDVLGRVGIVQQLSVTRVHQVDAELHRLLLRTLGDHVRKLRVLQSKHQTWVRTRVRGWEELQVTLTEM